MKMRGVNKAAALKGQVSAAGDDYAFKYISFESNVNRDKVEEKLIMEQFEMFEKFQNISKTDFNTKSRVHPSFTQKKVKCSTGSPKGSLKNDANFEYSDSSSDFKVPPQLTKRRDVSEMFAKDSLCAKSGIEQIFSQGRIDCTNLLEKNNANEHSRTSSFTSSMTSSSIGSGTASSANNDIDIDLKAFIEDEEAMREQMRLLAIFEKAKTDVSKQNYSARGNKDFVSSRYMCSQSEHQIQDRFSFDYDDQNEENAFISRAFVNHSDGNLDFSFHSSTKDGKMKTASLSKLNEQGTEIQNVITLNKKWNGPTSGKLSWDLSKSEHFIKDYCSFEPDLNNATYARAPELSRNRSKSEHDIEELYRSFELAGQNLTHARAPVNTPSSPSKQDRKKNASSLSKLDKPKTQGRKTMNSKRKIRDIKEKSIEDAVSHHEKDSLVHLDNGKKVNLHGLNHVYTAIATGTAICVQCVDCNMEYYVPKSASALFCIYCQQVCPIDMAKEAFRVKRDDRLSDCQDRGIKSFHESWNFDGTNMS